MKPHGVRLCLLFYSHAAKMVNGNRWLSSKTCPKTRTTCSSVATSSWLLFQGEKKRLRKESGCVLVLFQRPKMRAGKLKLCKIIWSDLRNGIYIIFLLNWFWHISRPRICVKLLGSFSVMNFTTLCSRRNLHFYTYVKPMPSSVGLVYDIRLVCANFYQFAAGCIK